MMRNVESATQNEFLDISKYISDKFEFFEYFSLNTLRWSAVINDVPASLNMCYLYYFNEPTLLDRISKMDRA